MDKRSIKLIPNEPWVVEFIEGFDFGIIPREYRSLIFSKLKSISRVIREQISAETLVSMIMHTIQVTATSTIISTIITSTVLKEIMDKFFREEASKYLREISLRK